MTFYDELYAESHWQTIFSGVVPINNNSSNQLFLRLQVALTRINSSDNPSNRTTFLAF